MNESEMQTPAALELPGRPPAGKSKRPWWVWMLAGLGGVLLLAVTVVLCGVFYLFTLINRHTQTQSVQYPALTNAPQVQKALFTRWGTFAEQVGKGKMPEPFRITEEDLNAMVQQNKEMRGRVWVSITNGAVIGHFSFPTDKGNGIKQLKGRHINGDLRLKILFEEGLLTVSVAEIKANNSPLPGWLLKMTKVQGQNFAGMLDKNHDALALMQRFDRIEVEGDAVVVTPSVPGPQ